MMISSAIRAWVLLSLFALCTGSALSQTPHGRQSHAVTRPARHQMPSAVAAGKALFYDSDLQKARVLAQHVLQSKDSRTDVEDVLDALFIEMEAAALEADVSAELDSAVRLCEMRDSAGDPRVTIAAARILENAGNTAPFRPLVPRLRALLKYGSAQSSYLKAALLAAAQDGMPGSSVADLARASGVLTEWTAAGPFGKYSNVAFEQTWSPERDLLRRNEYDGHFVERFQFDDGTFELPDYLSGPGVFYAATDVSLPSQADYRLRVESPGSLEILVDGTPVVRKDDRLRATPEVIAGTVNLLAGKHRLLLKFIANAAPFRVAIIPAEPSRRAAAVPMRSPLQQAYVTAARRYWNGDYSGAITELAEMRREHPSAAVDMLLAQAWQHVNEASNDPDQLAQEALKLAPGCIQANAMLALNALAQQRFEDAAVTARQVLTARPAHESALLVMATSAGHLGWNAQAADAYGKLIEIHASCGLLSKASRFATDTSDLARARALEEQLATCAPGSVAWPEALSNAGEHSLAANALRSTVAAHPLDRTARDLLVHELAFAGRSADASAAADELVRIAPGSARYRAMRDLVKRGDLPDIPADQMAGFADARQFYSAFRRDSRIVIDEAADRHFSGGPAVVLLHDRVVQLTSDNHIDLYVHKITRVLDRDGILQYGEIAVPNGASVLALRTIKADGAIAEPEITQHKSTISMPALSPGDAIDLEYVLRYPQGELGRHTDALEFSFGSFSAPILLSRFVVLSPPELPLQFVPSLDVPTVKVREEDGQVVREWERNNIAQSVSEVSMPRAGLLPSIRILPAVPEGWTGVRDAYRDALVEAVRIGSNVESAATSVTGKTDEQKIRAAYGLVTTRIRQTSPLFDSGTITTAEKTLSTYNGNRTAALIAISRALGIAADLIMARDASIPPPQATDGYAYTRPLVLFHLRNGGSLQSMLVDAETEGIGFGGIAPTIERDDALLVSIDNPASDNVRVRLPAPVLDDRSTAAADVTFDDQGNLSATLDIRMGASRSAQMRSILSGIEAVNRKHFFEQLATRIFPGASDASGEVRYEFDPDRPLELTVHCRAMHFANFAAKTADLDQLAPALGLRKMYASGGPRREPLFIDTPLIETARFRIRLPENIHLVAIPRDMYEENEFGSYSVTFSRESSNSVEIRRDFRVPVQIIDPARFDAFARFARRIDDAERQRLNTERLGQLSSAVAQ